MTINNEQVDLSADPIGVNWEYLNLCSPEKRYAPFSSSLTLPYTPANNKIMGFGNAVGADLTNIRSLPNVDLWFGHQRVIKDGWMKVDSSGAKGFSANVTGKSSIIDTLEGMMIDTAILAASQDFLLSSYADSIDSLTDGSNGFILPRALEGDITSDTWKIFDKMYELSYSAFHNVWINLYTILTNIPDVTFKVYEGGSFVALSASTIKTTLEKLYTPAWKYYFHYSNTVLKMGASHKRLFNDKWVDASTLTIDEEITCWDLVRIVSQLLCAAITIESDEISLIPLNSLSTTGAINLSGRIGDRQKYHYLPGQEFENHILYKTSDNLPKGFGSINIFAPVNPTAKKDLFTLDLMLPGLYYNETTGKLIFNTNPATNIELMKSLTILYDGGDSVDTTVLYELSTGDLSADAKLKVLTVFNFSAFYAAFQSMSAKGIAYDVDIDINPYDYLRLSPAKLIRIDEIGGYFYLNKITNYDPYSGKPAKCQIIKYEPTQTRIDTVSITYPNTGGDQDVLMLYNSAWTVISYPEWLSLSIESGTGGDTITITADENYYGQREGEILLNCGGEVGRIEIIQSSQDLYATPSSINFAAGEFGSGYSTAIPLTILPDRDVTIVYNGPADTFYYAVDNVTNELTVYPLYENTSGINIVGVVSVYSPQGQAYSVVLTHEG